MVRLWLLISAAVAGLGIWIAGIILLPTVAVSAPGGPDPPPILGAFGDDPPVTTANDWRERRAPILRAALAGAVFGLSPPDAPVRVLDREHIAYLPLAGRADVEQWTLALGEAENAPRFRLVLIMPAHASAPAPVIVMQNFCGNRVAFEDRPLAIAPPDAPMFPPCNAAWADPLVKTVFGRYINGPPFADIAARGYALAMFYPGEVAADDKAAAPADLERLYGAHAHEAGAIAVWAWLYSRAIDALESDPRIDKTRIAIWGHSRTAKAALWAAAQDARIALTIAHQPGRGGAPLNHSQSGETIPQLMKEYPHWYPPVFAHAGETDPALDEHQLLALIAPRPVLIGQARRDAWTDPAGAFRAARAAAPVYRLLGAEGLDQSDLSALNLDADVAFYFRPGLHGVTRRDWRVFLAFLDAHFRSKRASTAPAAASSAH